MDRYFEEKPDSLAYVALLDKDATPKVFHYRSILPSPNVSLQTLQTIIAHGRKTGHSLYVFALASEKVSHANFVSPEGKSKGLDARTWAAKVSDVLGGKASLSFFDFFD